MACLLSGAVSIQAETLTVPRFQYAGPFALATPFQVDPADVNSKAFDYKQMLDWKVSTTQLLGSEWLKSDQFPSQSAEHALNLASFSIENTHYGTAKFVIEGLSDYRLFVDGHAVDKESVDLSPATHRVIVKYLTSSDKKETPVVKLEAKDGLFSF